MFRPPLARQDWRAKTDKPHFTANHKLLSEEPDFSKKSYNTGAGRKNEPLSQKSSHSGGTLSFAIRHGAALSVISRIQASCGSSPRKLFGVGDDDQQVLLLRFAVTKMPVAAGSGC